ncbi:sigma 54-interacting transcriptional regulator [Clostridium tyrobutyricum]|uniref:sigma 54-interacting transcriptional regulator n=1 Tax=Clostridium tyrobutyricum TaxID=1519 RepID=UPI00030B454B|nr:sigma 54-interacting transcriptional regulator [Clostridium tyrobutyricum]
MIDKLIQIIDNEDKKNPMTDEQISSILKISREKVNELRQQLGIPSYLHRRNKLLMNAIHDFIEKDTRISYRKLCAILNKSGFKISTFGLNKYRDYIEKLKDKDKTSQVKTTNYRKNMIQNKNMDNYFQNIIGNNGSLNHIIKLAKAAVLYPKNGLHTLICGSTGVGKSQLVEQMNEFARKVRKKEVPFVVFNCADYGDNPQLLVSQLFGYKKGSFTGALSDKHGLIEKANNGMLFLDEIHRLPSKGQEILFRIIDKGEFTRLGETDVTRKVNVMIIGATTENVESNLLNTFRRRIPVLIEIPSLEERPTIERMQIINKFFKLEAQRINKAFYISGEVIKSFLFYNCPGNIGQLRSDIQVTCAKSFLNLISDNSDKMQIKIEDLPSHIKKQFSYIHEKAMQLNMIDIEDKNIEIDYKKVCDDQSSVFTYNVYDFIENRIEELKCQNKLTNDIKSIVSDELEKELNDYISNITNRYYGMSKRLLKDIVGKETVDIVDDVEKMLLSEIGQIDFSIYNVLCLHIGSAVERIRMGKKIENPKLETIKDKYKKEFKIALKIIEIINMKLNMNFPEDEAGFIALYLNKFLDREKNISESKVGIIIITHGDVSKTMLEISQSIIGIQHGIAITMKLDQKPEEVYIKVRNAAKKINRGKGILLLVDMGSLISFGTLITRDLGIPTKIVSRVDTLMVLEALRKSAQSTATLKSIFNSLMELERVLPRSFRNNDDTQINLKKKVIVTTCVTGAGTAIKIKNIILSKLKEKNYTDMEIIPVGLVEQNGDMNEKIENIRLKNKIVAIVGTVNPEIHDVPFMYIEEFLQNKGEELLINSINMKELKPDKDLNLKDLFDVNIVKLFYSIGSKEEIINIMARSMERKNYVRHEFYEDILDREDLGSSYIGNGVAIPHASYERNIIKPVIAVAVLKNPILWEEGNKVDIVFILALNGNSKKSFLKLFKTIKNTDLIESVKDMNDSKSVINKIFEYIE